MNQIVHTKSLVAARKRKVFLKVLAKTGCVSASAKACGYQDTSTLQAFRRDNDDFADEWADAADAGADVLIEEARRRAVDGVLDPVFFKGAIVGHVRKYSDPLLQMLLRGARPDTYRENARGGDMNVNFGIAVLPEAAVSDKAWEVGALEMHREQKTIEIEAKPTENAMLRVKRQRGD